ncbi:unnamed protein product [Penicillium nalgiovense]|nr:unnamed protein product [Penicillium nalgiovense]CAG8174073.1 unnamed protein product [Penicillium nalgiovense]
MISVQGKRTNSLGFAQTDCHTCASLGEKCDRRRPRCSTCLGQGRRCGGFAMPLSWDPRRMWSDNPSVAGASRDLPNEEIVTSSSPKAVRSATAFTASDSPKRFRFVKGVSRPKKRRRANLPKEEASRSVATETLSVTPEAVLRTTAQNLDIIDDPQKGNSLSVPELQDGHLFDDFSLFDSILPNIFASAPFLDIEPHETLTAEVSGVMETPGMTPLSPADRPIEPALQNLQTCPMNVDSMFQDEEEQSALADLVPRTFQEPTVSYSSARLQAVPMISEISSNDHEKLLELYDSEFCVLPLTGDIPGTVNPFRCKRQTPQRSRLLFHSILALCCQHLARFAGSWSSEAAEHRRKAVQLLECALQSSPCTLSATGNWSNHLMRAHSVLQTHGGPSALTTPRIRSQVAMLIWWDATLALISRQSPIMDQAYLKFLVRWEKQDEWSFFDLTGCPQELLVHLFQLAELAKQCEIGLSMKWLTFNMAPVTKIEHELIGWKNDIDSPSSDDDPTLGEEEAIRQLHEQQDRYHCAEAWRYALLLYLEYIFKGGRKRRSISVHRLVRKTIDHIRSCRRTSQTQKQLLIPVFLAGSETSDEDMRHFVKEYCAYWGEKCRYSMFNSVPVLFDEIWATGKWWGAVIDSKTRPSSGHGQGTTQLLFG